MWRSFFLAVGIGLFLMGGQALVIDHVVVPKNTKLQRLITKIMSDEEAAKESSPPQVAVKNNVLPNAAPWNAPNPKPQNDNFGYDSGSRYGPSRFSGPAYGNYGGQRMTSNQGFTGLGSQNQRGVPNTTAAQLASYNAGAANVAARPNPKGMQKVKIREWMPWSLLAAGSIIFFYTQSIHRRGFGE